MDHHDDQGTGVDATDDDDTFYIENDHMGESSFQFFVGHRMVLLLQYFLERSGVRAFVSGNQFMHLQKGDHKANIAPDVYVIPDEQIPEDGVRSWKLWEHGGKGPCLAIELVSDDPEEAHKDYAPQMLEKYQRMGVRELFRYDPYGVGRRLGAEPRRLLTHFVRQDDGSLREQPLTHRNRAKSVVFDFWLVHVAPRSLALGVGPDGAALFPSREEAQAQRAEEEARRAEEEARRAEEEARRAEEEARRAEEAEQRLQAALAEIERLKGICNR